MSRCISVVVPVYNEDRNIAACLRGLWSALRAYEHEILVCYDFDEDTTLAAIAAMEDAPPTLRLVRNDLGRGAANALRAGFRAARGDVVVTTMADLSDPPEVIPAMAAKMRSEGAAVVSGSRYMRGGSQTGGPLVKRCLSQGACLSLRWLAGIGTHDATSNFRAYSKDWLQRVEIESRQAFDIALEVTVKAHLAGETVAEVPSTWVDRVFGESRFKVLQWMPRYLRWYFKAMADPAAVWGVLLAALTLAVAQGGWTREVSGANTVAALLLAALATAFVLVARSVRGRMRVADVVHPLVWLHPWHDDALRAGLLGTDLLATAAASALWLALSCGWGRLRERARDVAARVVPGLRQGHLGLLLVAALVWLTYLRLPELSPYVDLDPSWQRAYGHFYRHGFQAGVDYIFTYGPLGFLGYGTFVPGTFWERVAWELLFKGLLALLLVLAVLRFRGPLDRTAYLVLLLVSGMSVDSYMLAACLALTLLVLHHDDVRVPGLAAAFAVLAMIATVKFTFLLFVGLCGCGIAAAQGARHGLRWGAAVLALFGLEFFALWWLAAGQAPWNFPAYLHGSLEITSGYNDAMSLYVSKERVLEAAAIFACAGLAALGYVAGRPFSAARAVQCALVLAGFFLAFKSAYVRHGGSVTFYAFAAVAVFYLQRPRAQGAARPWAFARDGLAALGRYGCAALAVAWNPLVAHMSLPYTVVLAELWSKEVSANATALHGLGELHERLPRQYDKLSAHFALPRSRAAIGPQPMDLLGTDQALAILNRFTWSPRPIFQSYSAYTPFLLRANARHLADEQAPPFVLVGISPIDERVPMLDDTLALQVLLRDHEPLLVERGYLLMRRRPDAPRPAPTRPVLLERGVAPGERIQLPGTEARCTVLHVELRPTLLGRLRSFLLNAPPVWLAVELDDGNSFERRLVPAMAQEGFVLEPWLWGQEDLVDWLGGGSPPGVRWIELRIQPKYRDLFEARARVRLVRADELVPAPLDPARQKALRYSMLATAPEALEGVRTPRRAVVEDQEVLAFDGPAQLRFSAGPGPHRVYLRYGLLDQASTGSDGVTFRLLIRDGDEVHELLDRHLDPRAEGDRGFQEFEVRLPLPRAMQLLVRTTPGPAQDAEGDSWFLSDVHVEPLGGLERSGG